MVDRRRGAIRSAGGIEHPTGTRPVGRPTTRRQRIDEVEHEWMQASACRHYPPAAFFPSDGVGVDEARKICATCPVQEPCLEYALANRIEHGVWGGCSERERRRILKRRRETAVAAPNAR